MNRTKRSLLFGFYLIALLVSGKAQQLGVGPTQPALSVVVPVITTTTSGTTVTPTVASCCGGIITTIVGNGTAGSTGDGGPASVALVSAGIRGLAADAAGDVFFTDDTNATVRVIYQGGATAAKLIAAENPAVTSPVTGDIYLIAGTEGTSGTPTSGALASSSLIKPGAGLSLDAAGDVYYNDTGKNQIFVIYAGGTGTTGTNLISLEAGVTSPVLGHLYAIAGNSTTVGYAGDGSLATASGVELYGVNDMKFDAAGDMFFVDQGNQIIREVSATTGILSTIAGTPTISSATSGKTGLNGPAISAYLNTPYGIAVDASGNVFIADKSNAAIKVVYVGDTQGTNVGKLIKTENTSVTSPVTSVTAGYMYQIAGVLAPNPTKLTPYGYLATSSGLNAPTMVALDAANDIYIMDNGYNVLQEINSTTGIMVTVAGNGTKSYAGDGGLANNGEFNSPRCVAIDGSGRIYITDAGNSRIREISQGEMSFVGQAAGTKSPDEFLQLLNTGSATLSITGSPTFAGTNAGDFSFDGSFTVPSSGDPYSPSSATACTFPSTLASGASCLLAITYAPTNSGTSAAAVSIPTNDALSPHVITLVGQLTPAPTVLYASATTAYPGEVVTLTALVQSPGGIPTGSVSFYQSGVTAALYTATLPASGSGAIVYTLPALNIGSYSYTAVYSGDINFAGSTSAAVTIGVNDFSISASPTTLSVIPGQAAQTTLTITGSGPTAQTLSLSCTTPSIIGCAFTPSSVNLAAGGTVTVSVEVAAVATTTGAVSHSSKVYAAALLPLGALLLLGLGVRRRSKVVFLAFVICLGSLGMLSGCSEKNNAGTPLSASTQTVTLNVSGTGGPTIFTQSIQLTVNVQ